jgi:hypothetical protein
VKSTYADRFVSPTREEIAAQVSASLPGKPRVRVPDPVPDPAGDVAPEPDTDPLACFSVHLRASMRAFGWLQEDLQERAGIGAHVAARAINGTGCDLGVAGKIAALTGRPLAVMIGPYACGTCDGTPPAGFRCMECSVEGARRG